MSKRRSDARKVETALRQVASRSSFDAAWKRLLQGSNPKTRRGFGLDGESIADVQKSLTPVLATLSSQMLARGGYRFSGLRPFVVEKKNGKKRIICVPTVRDRIVQRALLDFLSDGDKCRLANAVSFGFVPGKGVRRAAEKACELRKVHRFVYKTDIASFFDHLGREKLIAKVRHSVRQRSLWPILESALDCEIEESRPAILAEIRKQGIVRGQGVRQGMPLSPFFANVYLREFDRATQNRAHKMVRYADDLIFLADSESACVAIHSFVRDELAKIGLSVPEIGPQSKTQIYSPTTPAEFLGVDLAPNNDSYVLKISQQQISNACNRLSTAGDPSNVRQFRLTLLDVQRDLSAIEAGYLEAYKFTSNRAELERFLETTRRTTVSNLVLKMTGIDLGQLSDDNRRFLGA